MDEHKKYDAVSIPPRDKKATGDIKTPAQGVSPGASSYAAMIFAEIEIGFGSADTAKNADAAGATIAADGVTGAVDATDGATGVAGAVGAPDAAKAAADTVGAVGAAKAAAVSKTRTLPDATANAIARPQPIEQINADPIRQKIYDMRILGAGNPFAMRDNGLFYQQGKFMEAFTDDFQEAEHLSMYFPCYQLLGYRQLRTFFTWRTKVRRGEFPKISISYIFLYIYELLSNIGVSSSSEGLDRLMAVWFAYRESEPVLDDYLPRWVKDYHIYYPLPHGFTDFVRKYALWRYYPEMFAVEAGAEHSLALWNRISGYDVTKSSFYAAGNEDLFRDCFHAVLCGIRAFCGNRDIRFESILIYRTVYQGAPWHPFSRTLFHPWLKQADRQVEMPGQENYYCSDNRWTANVSLYHAGRKEAVGYLIRKTEECLRQTVKYKYKITADPSTAHVYFQKLKALGITCAELDGVIERSVADFYRDFNRTVVTVDLDNLDRIRREALGTQHKLIVPEEAAAGLGRVYAAGADQASAALASADPASADLMPTGQASADLASVDLMPTDQAPIDPLQAVSQQPAQVASEEQPVQAAPQLQPTQAASPQQPTQTAGAVSDGWAALKDALSDTELRALALVLQGSSGSMGVLSATLKAFADESGVMLEVLADGINEKAADLIGDNLLETDGGMTIYDEYKEKIAEMVGS
ncbi:MAG: TerB N-terminal domain-containing protein [Peptococcaceae bacterium]|jgi:hypothetical protein|nr:TerB N-terminal domain-containing protein [Peptococcaceae bacterium]